MFVCAYKRTVQGRVQISPVARYRSKRRSLLAAELRDASTGPVAHPPAQILQAQQNSLTPNPLTIAFAGSFFWLESLSSLARHSPRSD